MLRWSTDQHSLGFYQRMGGQSIGTEPSGIAGDQPLTLMELPLAAQPRPSIQLREISKANRAAVVAIHAGPAQGRFVSSIADSLQEAAETPEGSPWYRAVYLDGEPVGFVMLSWNVTPRPPEIIGPWFLWKLIVDERHQGRGIGRAIVEEVVRLIRAEGATELLTSHVIGAGGPDGFYERLGFVPTGTFDPQGERILRLELAPAR
jgi:GNAT superfamily N-acetyltransferase